MGRREAVIDPDDPRPEAVFARALRRLRVEAGNPTYRELEAKVGYSDSALSTALSGRVRPSIDLVSALVPALGGDPTEWNATYVATFTIGSAPTDSGPGAHRDDLPEDETYARQREKTSALGGVLPSEVAPRPSEAPAPGAVISSNDPGPERRSVGARLTEGSTRKGPHRFLVVALSVLLALLAGVAATQWIFGWFSPASTNGMSELYAPGQSEIAMRSCPSLSCPVVASWNSGTKVHMTCYRDAETVRLNYRSNRWFSVTDPQSGTSGWVHSSQVGAQIHVGTC